MGPVIAAEDGQAVKAHGIGDLGNSACSVVEQFPGPFEAKGPDEVGGGSSHLRHEAVIEGMSGHVQGGCQILDGKAFLMKVVQDDIPHPIREARPAIS